jgi:hypothetical protein
MVLKISSVFLFFRYNLPFKKGYLFHLNKLEFPPLKDNLCQIWLKLAPIILGKNDENVNVYRFTDKRQDGQTDDWGAGQRAIRKAYLSFQFK